MGLEAYYVANEGKMIVILPANQAEKAVSIMQKFEYGKEARIIGHVSDEKPGKVILTTAYGKTRLLPQMAGDLLPRIC